LTIKLPEAAKLFVQNQFVPGHGRKRLLKSEPARCGKDHVFDVRIEVVRDGVELTMSQIVRLRAGHPAAITFRLKEWGQVEPESHEQESEVENGEQPLELLETEDGDTSSSVHALEDIEIAT
jgi:uncharacterized protein (TIGR03000 family)